MSEATEHQDQQFLEFIIKLIVTEPEQVEITRTVDDLGVLITLKVSKDDMGRVIGKDGQTAKAIRTLLRSIGSRNNLRVNMKILEPEGSEMGFDNAPAASEAPAEAAPAPEAAPAEAPAEAPVAEEASSAAAEPETTMFGDDDGIDI